MFKRLKEDTTQIQDLQSLLKGINGKIVKHEVRPLTEFGENYGSEILRVDITVEENNGVQKVVHAVAKLIPPTAMQLEIFNTQVTFKNELGFYAETVPALEDFQRENGVLPVAEYVPKFLGGRINLKSNSAVVDNDAAIVLENLNVNGYNNLDRRIGFDLDSAKTVLQHLANFQATAVALRKRKPEVFDSKVMPYLHQWTAPNMPLDIDSLLKENPNTLPLIPRVRKVLAKKRIKKIREPWATITHNDVWVNNILVRESNGVIDSVRFVDFQITDYGSPAADVIFFLFSSVQNSVLQYHFDKLVQFYYKEFIRVLQLLKIDTKEFTWESFQDELNQEGGYQIFHSVFMIFAILAPKERPKTPGKAPEWNPNRQVGASNSHVGPLNGANDAEIIKPGLPDTITLGMKEKIWFLVEEAGKRNWI